MAVRARCISSFQVFSDLAERCISYLLVRESFGLSSVRLLLCERCFIMAVHASDISSSKVFLAESCIPYLFARESFGACSL